MKFEDHHAKGKMNELARKGNGVVCWWTYKFQSARRDLQTYGCPWGFTEGAKVGSAAHGATLAWGVQKGKAARERRQVYTQR